MIKNFKYILIGCLAFINLVSNAQDANNPIDPNPTLALFNREYGGDKSMTQLLGNITLNKWFVRFTTEMEFNYKADNRWTGGNILVSRLFESEDGKHKYGAGAIVSYFNNRGVAAGGNVVSVSQLGKWKLISLTTIQGGDDIFSIEFQPGIYYNLPKGWYLRSHPRWLFDMVNDVHEVPLGAGFGKILKANSTVINLLIEPQYDVVQNIPILYGGIKTIF